jgi:hypothetical protein
MIYLGWIREIRGVVAAVALQGTNWENSDADGHRRAEYNWWPLWSRGLM